MYWSIVQTVRVSMWCGTAKQRHGPQRYRCNNTDCRGTFFS